MDYSTLFNTIKAYTENDFPTTSFTGVDDTTPINVLSSQQINAFIMQAEDRVYNTVQIPVLRKNVTGVMTATNPYLSCPADYLSTYSMAVIDSFGNYEYLLNKDVNFIRASYPNPNQTSMPKYYALFGSQSNNINELSLILGPTPDQNYATEMHYYYYPPSIVQGVVTMLTTVSTGSGYVSDFYPSVYLTGGGGTGLVADITIVNGSLESIVIVDGGSLYDLGDVITVPTTSVGNVVGTPMSFTVQTVNNTDGTSWLGENYSPVLLYGSLVEAYTFMKGEADMIAQYEKKYQEAMGQLKRLGDGLERGDAYRNGQTKLPYKGL